MFQYTKNRNTRWSNYVLEALYINSIFASCMSDFLIMEALVDEHRLREKYNNKKNERERVVLSNEC